MTSEHESGGEYTVVRWVITRKSVDTLRPNDRKAPDEPIQLTKKQFETYDFIVDYLEKNGRVPSVREIQSFFGLSSTSVASSRLTTLKELGCLEQNIKGEARSYVPVYERGYYLPPKSDSE
jgi:hypothetical protein